MFWGKGSLSATALLTVGNHLISNTSSQKDGKINVWYKFSSESGPKPIT